MKKRKRVRKIKQHKQPNPVAKNNTFRGGFIGRSKRELLDIVRKEDDGL